MKRLFLAILLLFVFGSSTAWAVDSVLGQNTLVKINDSMYKVVIRCKGNISNTTFIPKYNGKRADELGLYLYRVIIENKSTWTTVTDDSDVYVYDSGGTDLLSGDGVDQLDDDTRNYIQLSEYEPIIGSLTLDVDNQAEAAGEFEITLILVK